MKSSLHNSYKFSFERLDVWHKSVELAVLIYELTKIFPKTELYGLSSQIQRAVVSISSNIAEGSVRITPKEQSRFYEIAFGSLMEVLSQLVLAEKLNYIHNDQLKNIRYNIEEISRMLNNLNKSNLERSEH